MAQLLVINGKTYKPNVNSVGDIIHIFDDKHQFSPIEIAIFDIIKILGTQKEIKSKFRNVKPTRSEKDKYQFNITMMVDSKWQLTGQ